MKRLLPILTATSFILATATAPLQAATYYVDNVNGNDNYNGLTTSTPWKTLDKVSTNNPGPGGSILLKSGDTFYAPIVWTNVSGTASQPITISSYGTGAMPAINDSGYLSCIQLVDCSHIIVNNLELINNGGSVATTDPAYSNRYGIYVLCDYGNTSDFDIENMSIHNIFSSTKGAGEAIFIDDEGYGYATISNVVISACNIYSTAGSGILAAGSGATKPYGILGLLVENCNLSDIGGPGIQPDRCNGVYLYHNTTMYTGSSNSSLQNGSGSGCWPWSCANVLASYNTFAYADGPHDSCGFHTDNYNYQVLVENNLSYGNAGGFIEILTGDTNICYRYNVSVNDGDRTKGVNGASQWGATIWTQPNDGHIYIYNNSIFTDTSHPARFEISPGVDGLYIQNNIFDLTGEVTNVIPSQGASGFVHCVAWYNNYPNSSVTIPNIGFDVTQDNVIGNPIIDWNVADNNFTPGNTGLKGKGIRAQKPAEDPVGIDIVMPAFFRAGTVAFTVNSFNDVYDYQGNPVPSTGPIDIGAVVVP